MNRRYGLQFQLTIAMLALVVICNTLFAFVIYLANDQFEDTLLDSQITSEMDEIIRRLEENSLDPLPQSANFHFYLDSRKVQKPIPELFSSKEAGTYHEVYFENRFYHLAVRQLDDDILYLAHDITEIEAQEHKLKLLLIAGTIITPLLTIWIGIWLSRKVIAPVRALGDEVANLDPQQRDVHLSKRYQGYEVERIAEAFDRYLKRMDEYVEREQSFSAAASHELRTPLSIISTSCELLADDASLSERSKAALIKITRASKQMSELVTAFLFLARGKTEALSKNAKTELCPLLQQILDNHRHLVNPAHVTLQLTCEGSTIVQAPESHISIVISNILRNAIYHTKAGLISVALDKRNIIIKDTGSGIAPENLDSIFTRQTRDPYSPGYGLGLHIAKSICDRYGWRIRFESQLQQGTIVVISMPV
jgi:signal transduction histidine kinase